MNAGKTTEGVQGCAESYKVCKSWYAHVQGCTVLELAYSVHRNRPYSSPEKLESQYLLTNYLKETTENHQPHSYACHPRRMNGKGSTIG